MFYIHTDNKYLSANIWRHLLNIMNDRIIIEVLQFSCTSCKRCLNRKVTNESIEDSPRWPAVMEWRSRSWTIRCRPSVATGPRMVAVLKIILDRHPEDIWVEMERQLCIQRWSTFVLMYFSIIYMGVNRLLPNHQHSLTKPSMTYSALIIFVLIYVF